MAFSGRFPEIIVVRTNGRRTTDGRRTDDERTTDEKNSDEKILAKKFRRKNSDEKIWTKKNWGQGTGARHGRCGGKARELSGARHGHHFKKRIRRFYDQVYVQIDLYFTFRSTSILHPDRPQFFVQINLNFTSRSTSIFRPDRPEIYVQIDLNLSIQIETCKPT